MTPVEPRPARAPGGAAPLGRLRLAVMSVAFMALFAVLASRLVLLSAGGMVSAAAAGPALPPEPPPPEVVRGEIVDRNGALLATSLPVASLFADGNLIQDAEEAARRLVQVLPELEEASLAERLDTDRGFVWLRRGLTPQQHYEINALGVPGFAFQTEQRRVYPAGPLTGRIVGYTDVDEVGLAGVERQFDAALEAGERVVLSLDLVVQAMLHQELATAMTEFNAAGAIGVILHVDTGEVRAMASLPDIDPSRPATIDRDLPLNPAVQGVYEMGSTFKIFNTALALETGVAGLDDSFDARHPLRFGGHTIHDYYAQRRWLTVAEIFRHSSNIGSARMAMAAGQPAQAAMMDALGLTSRSPVELPEAAYPLVPDPWRDINMVTISFGHGISVSPMQLASATAAVVGDGILRPATLLARPPGAPVPGTRVLSSETSAALRWLMRDVVENGTGGNADAAGYEVGGKTGTAEKVAGSGYDGNAVLSSFVAAFPMSDPEFVVLVMLDEPNLPESQGRPTGGRVAAPVVRRVIERLGPMTGRAPAVPAPPEIREASAGGLPVPRP
jgi:cell division protein FtsI (penicillin-binding protein 3)